MSTRKFIVVLVISTIALVTSWLLTNRQNRNSTRRDHQRLYSCRPEFDTRTRWNQPKFSKHLLNSSQTTPELIEHICKDWLLPPSTKPCRLKRPWMLHYSASNQSSRVDEILCGRTNGFFIECGAADGETLSNSLFFENSRNWIGVLIEGFEPWFRKLLWLRRYTYSVGACLSALKRPVPAHFTNIGYGGGLIDYMKESHLDRFGGKTKLLKRIIDMQCRRCKLLETD